MEFSAASDAGRVRTQNEDSFTLLPLPRGALLAVADGVGGNPSGDVASRIATRTLADVFGSARTLGFPDTQVLCNALQAANQRILAASSDGRNRGMGTTMTAAWIVGDRMVFAHVGDSRLYFVRDGQIQRLTEDHSMAEELVRQGEIAPEEAKAHPQRHVLMRALGHGPVDCDCGSMTLQEGDTVLLCTDGLTDALSEEEVARMLAKADFAGIALQLVEAANAAGGPDNITVVAVRLQSADLEAVSGA